MKKFAVILTGLFFAFALQAQSPLNWTGDTDIELFQETGTVHAGSYSCGVIVNTGTQANCDLDNDVPVAVTGGNTFKMSFWGYTSEFVRVRAKLTWSNGNTTYATTYLGPNTGGWQEFSFEGDVPADATDATVGVRFYDVSGFSAGEIQYIDDITFESPTGTPLAVDNGDFEQWSGLSPEPDNYPTDFTADAVGLSVALSWTDATGTQLPAAYLIKASTEDNITLPEDGTFVPDDTDLSDGSGAVNVAFGQEAYSFANLAGSTGYYFKIFPYTNSGANVDYKTDGTPPAAEAQTADVVIINQQDFNAGFGAWTSYSVTGDEEWVIDDIHGMEGTPCAKMTGFVSGTAYPNEDWLISPAMNFNNFDNEIFSFYSAVGYITANETFGVRISTDYDGSGNPNDFTWTDLNPVLPDGGTNWVWTYSDDMDVSSFNGDNVYVAFTYYSDDQDASTWELDNIMITGEGEYVPDPEPTNYPTAFAALAQGQDIDLSWTDATGAQLPAGYLVLGSNDGSFDIPVDGTPVNNDADLSDGYGVLNIAQGAQSCSFNNLPANTTYYFTVYPYTNAGQYIDYKTDGTAPTAEATTIEVSSLLFTDFNDDWGGWTPLSVVGDQVWSRDNTYGLESTPCALMSGYAGGTNYENEDWLISPALDFTATTNEALAFFSAMNYTGPQLELLVSTNYDGTGNPNDFDWTNLTDQVNWSSGAFAWTESGMISLSQFTGNSSVYIGFQFFSTTENSANWEIDDVEVSEAALTPEPTNYPGSFTALANQQTITLSWTDATGDVLPEAYLIKANVQNAIVVPVDGQPVANDPDLSDGIGAMNIAYGVQTYTFTGLTENTTYYFKIFPFTNSGSLIDYKTDGTSPSANATTEENPYTDLLFTTFNESWEDWEQVSIVGDEGWDRDNTYGIEDTPCASMSGYNSGTFENEDWLISPGVVLGPEWLQPRLIFNSAVGYTGPALEVKISTDYDGGGDPGTATWTDLTDQATWPDEGSYFVWTNSGNIDLESYSESTIHVAFVYHSITEAATWEVDNISVQGIFYEGVDETPGDAAVQIYPNPGNGIFNIDSRNRIQALEVYSMTGDLVFQTNPDNNSTSIDLTNLVPGIYFARMIDPDNTTITRKIVIR